jgi:hypothetical protein
VDYSYSDVPIPVWLGLIWTLALVGISTCVADRVDKDLRNRGTSSNVGTLYGNEHGAAAWSHVPKWDETPEDLAFLSNCFAELCGITSMDWVVFITQIYRSYTSSIWTDETLAQSNPMLCW